MNTGLRIRDASPLQSGAYFLSAMPRHSMFVLLLLFFATNGVRVLQSMFNILLKDHGKVKN
jgi:hypothetical protein